MYVKTAQTTDNKTGNMFNPVLDTCLMILS
ncbi:hypothetical protein NPIRD3C_1482 [Nitrosopumilus piranensis]|uniref:Uncharacterized protein n=1 Tax=Nitrosopumilus piranensis TaxID=1582439 RepID=A0A0C5BWR2_9ARCH|nr:hypothetical protein NPIRD3C_1482 [Nitrosopumilus piranensis]